MKLDHIALGTKAFEERSAFFTEVLGLNLLRTGVRYTTGTRISMLGTGESEFKIELIELAPSSDEAAGFMHLAFRVDNIDAAYSDLRSKGLTTILEPHDLKKANAVSALLTDASGLQIQIIQYNDITNV